ncbi:MAG: hypothetical protein IJR43_04630 [Synergistaceae bacterium]|nr:hypothetical protein [Synergistaceae bacterium]MBR0250665.1 hypothetical protein [Synergistaceae bacterium]
MKEKINDVIERLFHLECEVMSIHKASDEWLKVNRARKTCIALLNALNN